MKVQRRWIIWGAIVLLVLVLGFWAGTKAVRLWRHLDSLRTTLPRLEANASGDGLGPEAITALVQDFDTLATDLTAVEREVSPFMPLTRIMGWVPTYGGDIKAAPELLDVASGVARAGDLVLEGAGPLVDVWQGTEADVSGSLLERVLPALTAARPQLLEAQAELEQVLAARAKVDQATLSPRVGGLLERLDRYLPLLQVGVSGIQLAPRLLGADEPRTYLVIAQNNHELRATGGFISGVGFLRMEEGRIVELSFDDSYTVDDFSKPHPPPPDPLLKYMKAEILVLRDANWSPDFPTAAQALAGLFALNQGVVVDGVIAADLTAVRWMVKALEPIYLEGVEQPVTGDNVMDYMKLAWGAPQDAPSLAVEAQAHRNQWREWLKHRKDFMGLLLGAMRSKVEGGQDVDLGRVLSTVLGVLDEKHVLISVDDAETAELLAAAGWSGALDPGDGDFLMIVDTNMGFNKVNPNIEQKAVYSVELAEDGSAQAELRLRYWNRANIKLDECIHEPSYGLSYDDMMNRCYWDYVRVYVPGGSELQEAVGFQPGSVESLAGERDTQVLAGFFVLAPGEGREITLRYELPDSVVSDALYRLRLQKQPGTNALPVTVRVSGAAEAEFETELFKDEEFGLSLDGG